MRPPDDAPQPLARIFLALMVGPHLGARVLRTVREALGLAAGPNLRLYRSEDLHLTLVFIGLVPRPRVAQLSEAVTQGRPRVAPLELGLALSGAFPGRKAPRVLWLALEERRPGALAELARLREGLAGLCRSLHLPVDPRPFVPHLTVARLRSGARPPPAFWDVDADAAWTPGELALVESVTGAGQSAFRVLHTWPLEDP